MPFPTTRWSLLAQASIHGDAVQTEAWAEFYRRYQGPVIAFIRRQGRTQVQAEDLAQEFFIYVIENATLQRADPLRGRFRSFLLKLLVRYLSRDRVKGVAVKRGGGLEPLPLDAQLEDELAVPAAVAHSFDRTWAWELLALTKQEQALRWVARDRAADLAKLEGFLPGSSVAPTYEEAAQALGWTLARLKTEVFRLRQEFREILRAEVALTVDEPGEVDAELRHLHTVLADPSE